MSTSSRLSVAPEVWPETENATDPRKLSKGQDRFIAHLKASEARHKVSNRGGWPTN